jgi:hypothetical protein
VKNQWQRLTQKTKILLRETAGNGCKEVVENGEGVICRDLHRVLAVLCHWVHHVLLHVSERLYLDYLVSLPRYSIYFSPLYLPLFVMTKAAYYLTLLPHFP